MTSLRTRICAKTFSSRFPQPAPGRPDDLAAVLLALPHVLQSWLALVRAVQREHALLRPRPDHQRVSGAAADIRAGRVLPRPPLELAQTKAAPDIPNWNSSAEAQLNAHGNKFPAQIKGAPIIKCLPVD